MARAGVCCASLQVPQTLMKMGLCMLLLGHVNFLLAALMHGVVLRHVGSNKQAGATEYSIANVVAIASGLVGVVGGILAIVLSKNKKSRGLTWCLLWVGLAAALLAAASAVGLSVSAVSAVVWGGRNLLTRCHLPDAVGYFSITDECAFDPTRVYSTTLILWVPLILTCGIQMVFSARCFAACVSFLGLTCCRNRKTTGDLRQAINVVRPMEEAAPSRPTEGPTHHTEASTHHTEAPTRHTEAPIRHTEAPIRYAEAPIRHTEASTHHTEAPTRYAELGRSHTESPTRYGEAPTRRTPRSLNLAQPLRCFSKPLRCYSEPLSSHREPPWQNTEPPRRQHKPPALPQLPPHQHRSLPPSGRRPPCQPDGGPGGGGLQRAPERHRLLQRATPERSSFWI